MLTAKADEECTGIGSTHSNMSLLRSFSHNAIAASTVQTYERTWDASFTDIGFNNRLFLVPGSGKKRHSFPAKIPEIEKRSIRDSLGGVLKKVGSSLELNITPDAKDIYYYLSRIL